LRGQRHGKEEKDRKKAAMSPAEKTEAQSRSRTERLRSTPSV